MTSVIHLCYRPLISWKIFANQISWFLLWDPGHPSKLKICSCKTAEDVGLPHLSTIGPSTRVVQSPERKAFSHTSATFKHSLFPFQSHSPPSLIFSHRGGNHFHFSSCLTHNSTGNSFCFAVYEVELKLKSQKLNPSFFWGHSLLEAMHAEWLCWLKVTD